ncbi:unnamed protein product [Lymnaea stagnalis]|uniref:Major facilitator superfamily (MFS) profile domain-containing protein n=1 Tax=Lymnaea stagnalis TaxID=6523 RepID=A0AAV2IEN3_LYMST
MVSTVCGIQRWRGVLVVLGGMLIHLSLGTLYTFGNLNPYMTSYMRAYGSDTSLTYTDCTWVFALACIGQGGSMALGGVIEKRFGPKLTALLGGWCMSLGVMLTYFAVKQSFVLTIITYGAVFGFGIGIVYSIPLACSMRWFPERKGLVNGLVVAGFGGGAFIFNQLQTGFINPNNFKPDHEVDGEKIKISSQIQHIWLIPYCKTSLGLIVQWSHCGMVSLCNVLKPPVAFSCVYFSKLLADGYYGNAEEDQEKTAILEEKVKDDQTLLGKSQDSVNIPTPTPDVGEDDDVNVAPSQMIQSKNFWLLWFIFLLNGQGSTFISSLYKAYGQTFIVDDTFLALVGAFAALFNAVGRIIWGLIADRFSFRVSLLLVCAFFTCLMLTFQVSEHGGKPLFFIYVCLLFGSFSGSFALFPTATAKCFGRKNLSVNYGLVFTSQMITAPLGALLSQNLKSSIGWNGLFFMVSGFSFLGFVLTIMFRGKDKKGNEI